MSADKIFTNDNCVGCNRCVAKCPCEEANVAKLENGKNKVYVDETKCIACGECLRSCTHDARDYSDDTERFFADLSAGQKISLIVAPALRSNIAEYANLLGYLKQKGVNALYDASFGADICTWAYLQYITKTKQTGLISQPCPAIVNYIECYVPELLGRLAPIQSPAMCTAIYMKKYKNIGGAYAFLSPCVAKRNEFNDINTGGLVSYNVTFKKLLAHLEKNNIDFTKSAPAGYDNEAHGLGSVYSSPGGLKANVEKYAPNNWVYQKEGQPHVSEFLHEYVKEKGDTPFLVDVLSCEGGCNIGTGGCRKEDEGYAASKAMFNVQKQVAQGKTDLAKFDKELNLSDFKRAYTPKKITQVFVDRYELEQSFTAMLKPRAEDRITDCRACGYVCCQKMAVAVAKGVNHVENCVDYLRFALKKSEGGNL
jgi:iron only hydrogenase large subunit-like protein